MFLVDKKGIDGRLASAQTALMLQEETIRRNERERKQMADKIANLERTNTAGDSEKRQLTVRFSTAPKQPSFALNINATFQ